MGGCTMDKVRSIKILRNCIERIRNASDAEKEEMARVYEKYDKSDYEEADINNLKEGENMAVIEHRIDNYNKFIEETLDYIYDIKEKFPAGEQRLETCENIVKMLNSIDIIIQYVSKKTPRERNEYDLILLNEVEFKVQTIKTFINIREDIRMLYYRLLYDEAFCE